MRWLTPLLLMLTLLTACAKPERPHPGGPGAEAQKANPSLENVPRAAPSAKDSQLTAEQKAVVLAKIGDRSITLGELEARLQQEPPVVRSQFASVQKRKDYLQKLVQFEVLVAEAQRRGLDRDPDVVEALKQAMVRRYLQDEVKDDVKPESIPEADLKAYYDNNPGLYHKPEQVEVSHILLATQAEADKIAGELKGASEGNPARLVALWNDYVVRLSLDKATAPYLGSLGLLSREPPVHATPAELERLAAVPKPVLDAAFGLAPLTIGPVVQTEHGFHVIMVTSKSPAVQKTFEEVKDSIRARIVKRERDLRREKVLADLRAKAKVEVNDDAVRLLPAPPVERAGMAPPGATLPAAPAQEESHP